MSKFKFNNESATVLLISSIKKFFSELNFVFKYEILSLTMKKPTFID